MPDSQSGLIPPPIEEGSQSGLSTLIGWRERLLNGMLYAAAALGLPAAISGSMTAVRDGQTYRIGVFAVAYAFILLITFGRRFIPYWLRAGSLVSIAFLLGVDSLRTTGLGGSGRVFLVAFAIIATMLFGLRGGLVAMGLSLLSTIIVAIGMSSGSLPITPDVMASTDSASWVTGGAVFSLLTIMLVVALGSLQRGLETALTSQTTMLEALKNQQGTLERRVVERTQELQRRALQLETTAEIAKLTAESPDLDQLLQGAVELIKSRFGFYHASVFLLDPSRTWAELTASTGEAGRRLLERGHKLAVGSASIIGWVTANRRPRVTPDVSEDPFHYRNPDLPDTRSEMAVPLTIGNRLIGALDVQSDRPDAFSEPDMRATEAIAGELAFAIENSRLLTERQAQIESLEGEVRSRIRTSWSQFGRSGSPTVIHLGSQGEATSASEGAFGHLDEASQRGETVISDDGAEVIVPVRVRGETIAAIAARKPEPRQKWESDDIALMEAVAGQAALALETARQYEEEQRRVAELEVVNRISQAASQLLRLDTLLRMVGRQITQVMGQTDVEIGLYDPESRMLDLAYVSRGEEEGSAGSRPVGQSLAGVVLRTRQPLMLVEDVPGAAAELGARFEGTPPKSWLGVPMLVGDQVIGLIIVRDDSRARRFTDDDAALLSTVAGQVATALQNARLLEQVQRTARRERMVHEIASKVRSAPDIQTVLETTAREVGRAFQAARATVRLGREFEEEHQRAQELKRLRTGDGRTGPEQGNRGGEPA